MERIFEGVVAYTPRNRLHRNPTTCHMEVWQNMGTGWALVIATEIADNHGLSINNSSEDMATYAVGTHKLDPLRTAFIEHFNAASYSPDPSQLAERQHPDEYTLVNYDWQSIGNSQFIAHKPRWQHMSHAVYARTMASMAIVGVAQ
jgi:hypothetical protein